MDTHERKALQLNLVRLSQGERAAFQPVFAALWPLLSALCTRALGDSAAGEDAAQSALCKIFARADELDPERDAVAWAAGVALWECRTQKRRTHRHREDGWDGALEQAASIRSSSASPEESTAARELRVALVEVMGALRPADAAVLESVLRSEQPKLPSATFRKRLQRAMARLREAWRHRHGTE